MAARRGGPHAVVLAGGAGERFWPASRQRHPKPFLRVVAGRSLLEATLARARRFAGDERLWVVCGEDHAGALRARAGLPPRRVLVEPRRRNTAMAVGLAAERIAADDPDAVLAVLPADHVIPDAGAFARAMRVAAHAARDAGALVTLGIRPTRPDTGYGYIHVGRAVGARHPGLVRARRFVEKPDASTARRYLRHGGYLWNAGIFVFTARALLEDLEAHAPSVFRALAPVRSALWPGEKRINGGTRRRSRRRLPADALRAAYRRAPSEPIDTAVMERSARVWTLPVDFHWSDVGTWQSLAEELGVSRGRSRVLDGDVVFDDPGGNLVWCRSTRARSRSHPRVIALLGVEGLAVIDTGDALLVASLERSPEARRIVAELKARGRADVT